MASHDVPAPHVAKLECIGPDHHFFGWTAGEWTLERALAWVMPFGKHKGLTLEQVNEIDRGYLKWIAKWEEDNAPREACRIILAEMPSKPKNAIQPLPGQMSFIEHP